MPKGTRRASYVRDNRGRFASTPGGGAPKRPPAKKASRGTNRLTRDNSGRITSVGGNGATARGGRLRTGAGNLRARQTDRLKGAPQGVLSRGGKARGRVAAAKKPVGWMQSPEARKDRVDPVSAANRKDYARRLRALPKAAQRAIQVERSARKRKFFVAGNTAAQLSNLSEGRMQLIANVGKRKNKLTPGQIDAITRSMSQSARRLKVGMATGNRGRMKYNPKALQLAPSTAARKISGARVGRAGAMKGKPTGKAATIGREQFVGRQGSRTTSMGEAIASASPGGRTRMSKKQEGRMIATAERQMSAIRAKNQRAGALYDALARAGRVKPPKAENRIARLTRAAQGDPNTERAKAAQRLLAKRAAKPAAPKRVTAGRQGGTIAKPRGMKSGALAAKRQKPTAKVDMKQAINRAKELRQQASKLMAQGEALMGGGRRDGAIVNVPLGSRSRRSAIDQGIRGAQLVARAATLNNRADRVLERAVASRKKAEREATKPKRAPRSAESLRLSRAKQVEKRRSITTNPAGNRADAAGRMAANAARTQQRALAFYGKKPRKGANAIKPSPRRLNAAEKAYIEIRAQRSKFRSDKKVIAEMIRRGFLKGPDPQGQAINIASSARRKKGSP